MNVHNAQHARRLKIRTIEVRKRYLAKTARLKAKIAEGKVKAAGPPKKG